jgi:DNA-binding transcriptional MerR regulator
MKIGELSALAGVPIDTIRFYERIHLLPTCIRDSSNYRNYSQKHVELLLFIKSCKALNMALDEISLLVSLREEPSVNCEQVNLVIDKHLAGVQAQLAELTCLHLQLLALKQCCRSVTDTDSCGIIKELSGAV